MSDDLQKPWPPDIGQDEWNRKLEETFFYKYLHTNQIRQKNIGRSWYLLCPYCRTWVKDKWLLGTLHFCGEPRR